MNASWYYSLLIVLTLPITSIHAELGESGVCVIGCTPYIRWDDQDGGRRKYQALIEDIANNCDIIVHIGDTKVGKKEKCNEHTMTRAIKSLRDVGREKNKLVLYAPGDNEVRTQSLMRMQTILSGYGLQFFYLMPLM